MTLNINIYHSKMYAIAVGELLAIAISRLWPIDTMQNDVIRNVILLLHAASKLK